MYTAQKHHTSQLKRRMSLHSLGTHSVFILRITQKPQIHTWTRCTAFYCPSRRYLRQPLCFTELQTPNASISHIRCTVLAVKYVHRGIRMNLPLGLHFINVKKQSRKSKSKLHVLTSLRCSSCLVPLHRQQLQYLPNSSYLLK
jgi:hypothetical protein